MAILLLTNLTPKVCINRKHSFYCQIRKQLWRHTWAHENEQRVVVVMLSQCKDTWCAYPALHEARFMHIAIVKEQWTVHKHTFKNLIFTSGKGETIQGTDTEKLIQWATTLMTDNKTVHFNINSTKKQHIQRVPQNYSKIIVMWISQTWNIFTFHHCLQKLHNEFATACACVI